MNDCFVTILLGEQMNAAQLKKGESARVVALHHPIKHQERLTALGIYKNAMLTYHTTTLFFDPLLFEVEGRLLAIRKKDAYAIEVEQI